MERVFVHGLGQTPTAWEKVLLHVNDGEHSLCPDLIVFGRNKDVSYENLYKGLVEFCNNIDAPIDLCGLSLGGVLALNYAIDNPEKVNSLVLIATQFRMPKRLLKIQNILFRFMPKSMFQSMGFEKHDYIYLCKTMMELDFCNSLHTITCPVMVVYGEKDYANKKAAVELASILKNSMLKVIRGSGHEVNIDEPEKLGKLLSEFYYSNLLVNK